MLKKITNYARANVKLPSNGLFPFIYSQERCKINIQNLSFIIHAGYAGSDHCRKKYTTRYQGLCVVSAVNKLNS